MRQCAKCGGTNLHIRFYRKGDITNKRQERLSVELPWGVEVAEPFSSALKATEDILVVHCTTCQYWWTEVPGVPEGVSVIIDDIRDELDWALAKFPRKQTSLHEAYAVLLEEVDELWDEIKHGGNKSYVREEAIQVAAMAVRLVLECIDTAESTNDE